jgi:hypothetical protein
MEAERFARARELHTLVDHLPDVVVRYDLQLRRTYPGDGCVHARRLCSCSAGTGPAAARSMQRDAENIAVTLVFDEHVRRCIKAGEEVLQLAWDTLYAGGVDIGVPG